MRARAATSKATLAVGAGLTAILAIPAVFAGQQPPATPQPGPAIRSSRQPIGRPRITLDPQRPLVVPDALLRPGACVAPLDVRINVPRVGLNLRTEEPAVWYSLVDTIPPVGHTASITTKPVRLLDGDRAVGSLIGGEVTFREVVRDVALSGSDAENRRAIDTLLGEMRRMSESELLALGPLNVQEFVLPPAGVQVMRARLSETYEIEGIGRDTVELLGWIAVRHGDPRPSAGETEVSWETAVLDTEFVGLSLRGTSKVFGPIDVSLDTTRPALGQVGKIEIPELARVALLAKYQKEQLAGARGSSRPIAQAKPRH